ncbi:MAG: hypothetical protein Q9227_005050 [Pyrenula ochraceoflavens]
MAAEIPQQTFQIKEIPTKNVTLYPSRAHIVREIENVVLKPGLNEIEIYGITPTADEHSVQIDAQGAATVTDLAVALVPNHEIFEETFPSEDEGETTEEPETEDDEEPQICRDIDKEISNLKSKIDQLLEVQQSCDRRLKVLDSYASTLKADKNSSDDLVKLIKHYKLEREQIYKEHSQAGDLIKSNNKVIETKTQERWRAGKEHRKRRQLTAKQKEKEQLKISRQRAEKRKEARRVKEERLRYWAKKVYSVTVQLETSTFDTPGSSRRNSADSVTLNQVEEVSKKTDLAEGGSAYDGRQTTVSLTLSYSTREASWLPRYDYDISSVKKTGKIVYRAEYQNATSETWKDAHVTLSTSQTSYQGLDDTVPYMHSWHVRLRTDSGPSALMSNDEMNKKAYTGTGPTEAKFNRNEVFGSDTSFVPVEYQADKHRKPQKDLYVKPNLFSQSQVASVPSTSLFSGQAPAREIAKPSGAGLFGPNTVSQEAVKPSASSLFGNARPAQASGTGLFGNGPPVQAVAGSTSGGGGLFSNAPSQHFSGGSAGEFGQPARNSSVANNALNSVQPTHGAAFGSTATQSHTQAASAFTGSQEAVRGNEELQTAVHSARRNRASVPWRSRRSNALRDAADEEDNDEEFLADTRLDVNADDELETEESAWTDEGLAISYDIPGKRTLVPSSIFRRYKVATLHLNNIHLSYVVVPKLRVSAFLRAKIRNPSNTITLLKGLAGVTVDRSFLGTMTLPRVSAGQIFDLPLGVDPGIHVNYPRPTVKRATQGLFNKESTQTFSRSAWVTNTKTTPVELLVLDQIPVSEDERLRIEVLNPRGLNKEGDSNRAAGRAAKEAKKPDDGKWGSATAKRGKDGKIEWTVNLERGGACVLNLDYEARLPGQERIVQA